MTTATPALESMTGFGRGVAPDATGDLVVELRAVNSRTFDFRFRAPARLSRFEGVAHDGVKRAIARGRIDCAVTSTGAGGGRRVRVDEGALASLVASLEGAVARFPEIDPTISAGALLRMPMLFVDDDDGLEERTAAAFVIALDGAVAALVETRRHEGRALDAILRAHLDRVDALRAELVSHSADTAARQRTRLLQRLAELAPDLALDPARVATEVALLADRADVTEELARLAAHVTHARAILDGGGAVGRKLDFLCQELLREANTTGSKSLDAALTHVVVDLKAEIERFREQVQNVA